jgi:PleD family two-component response regulator
MNADAMATRMSVLTRALPSRILIVDDDELEAALMADRLRAAGFEVTQAVNGLDALGRLEELWCPLVITDWQMPVMDGIEFTEALRARGVEDTYIIMLSAREASVDYERGYVSGVDDYLTKKVPDAELFARIHAAFNTLALRRSLREAQAALEQSVAIDVASGAFAASELQGKLNAEVRRAQRFGRQLAVIKLGVHVAGHEHDPAGALPSAEVLRELVRSIDTVVRAHVDWVGRAETAFGAAFAIVLPEAGICEAPVIKDRLLMTLRRYADSLATPLVFTFGVAALERGTPESTPIDAGEMLKVSAHCRTCPGRTSPEQLAAVQRSVSSHVAIACRHGYVVDNECSLKGARAARNEAAIAELLAG